MHLLVTKPGAYQADEGITHLAQTPAELVILSTADTHLALLAETADKLPECFPSLRLANPLHLQSHASVDLYVDEVLQHAKVIVVALLGGVSYWRYGIDQIVALGERGVNIILVPGDDHPDPGLSRLSTAPDDVVMRVWRYLRDGGPDNARYLFHFLGHRYFDQTERWMEPTPLPKVAIYHPHQARAQLSHWQRDWRDHHPVGLLLFYRSHLQAGNTVFVDAFCEHLRTQGINPLPVAIASLKEAECLSVVEMLCEQAAVEVILNTTGFAMSNADAPLARPFQRDIPVLQVILSSGNEDDWRASAQGLSPRDLAMQIALPELDGRIITRPVSFKGLLRRSERTQSDVVVYQAVAERMRYVAALAYRWVQLARTPAAEKRVTLVLANYPTRDGRLGNGVGLDTPASVVNILHAMAEQGYPVADLPVDGSALIQALLGGVTNDLSQLDNRPCHQSLSLEDYNNAFSTLPIANQNAIKERWGEPQEDPMYRSGRMMVAGLRFGLTFVGIQPARGFHLDASAVYHDPDLVPPHGYLAFYFWLRELYRAHAIVHVGKHGNLEWLPGKGVGLSDTCWPDAILGPVPNIYPFIVNDPGEGAQAKRRTQAVIIDHLVPPLTRAESYGPLRDLERLADEYYDAMDMDPHRARLLRADILQLLRETHLDRELKLDSGADADALLRQVDAYLCELKESQIRDGLHIFAASPTGDQRLDTLLALVRMPRADERNENASLLRALAKAFVLDFDPLECDMAAVWEGHRPTALHDVSQEVWRTAGDTRERLELFARALIARWFALPEGDETVEQLLMFGGNAQHWNKVASVLNHLKTHIAPAFDACGSTEINGLLAALAGRFVPAGPSGAPSRGRLDVLPTGRNFYSVDTRSVPTPTAWRIGLQSALALLERHLQDHGEYPRAIGISVWGTATMRTGGDDIAQALALLGVRPIWAPGSQRVVDFEILPLDTLDRPRIDVTLRVSGFFRDAFPGLIRLFDAAVQAVASLDEPESENPIRARIFDGQKRLQQTGLSETIARQQAGWRVFGSKPGAYGAGLQGPIDERCWQDRADLAEVYLNWGGYAYGSQDSGTPARERFVERIGTLDAVVQNQDNREHDILDSDDYYQFLGGMVAAVEVVSGRPVVAYHGDNSQAGLPRIRTLKEELNRVIRSRAANPKWINGVKRHGYKGAFEMAATVDYVFAFDATTQLVDDHQYALLADAYLLDADTRRFLQQHNPDALREMTERLLEAQQRGLWEQPGEYAAALENLLMDVEEGA